MVGDVTGPEGYRIFLPRQLSTPTKNGKVIKSTIHKETNQTNLIIDPPRMSSITVDNLEVAQFIHLLINNEKIRDVIDAITSKMVLILGRFTDHAEISAKGLIS